MNRRRRVLVLTSLLAAGFLPAKARSQRDEPPPKILVFTRTTGFRHDSIPVAIAAVREIGDGLGFAVDATEDPSVFTPPSLSAYRAVVFLNTTGDILDASQRSALQGFVTAGGGFAGVHSAADTEYSWPWYRELLGARFASHPAIQPGLLRVVSGRHPATRSLPRLWQRTDEWYNFDARPSEALTVLISLDESSYSGGAMGADHPIAWCRKVASGRSFYTAGGHTAESFAEPEFLSHLAGGILWAAGPVTSRPPPRRITPR